MRPTALRFKKTVVGLLAAATLAGVGGVVASADALAATQLVATGNVNLRSGPSTSYPILATILLGSTVTATGVVSGGWTQVTYAGKTGYASSAYLEPAGPTPTPTTTTPTATGSATTTGNVNVRTGPGTSYAIVGVATTGTVLPTTGVTSGGWTQVVYSGAARWVSSAYLTTGPTTPTSPTIVGQVRTLYNVNLRTDGNITATIVGVLPANTVVDVTGKTTDTYTQIYYNGQLLWIYTAYTSPVTSGPTATASERIATVIAYATSKLGDAYVWGGAGPDVFDCSGLTMMAYSTVGISLPHHAADQALMGTAVARADLKPGDLIFWYTPVGHVTLYIGNGQMIHARGTAYGVVQQSVDSYILAGGQYVGARRYITS